MIPSLFPPGSGTDKSKAKPEIWQKWPEFEAAAKNLGVQAEKLRDAARAKNEQLTQDLVKDFGRQACGTLPHPVPPAPAGRPALVALRSAAFIGAGATRDQGGPAP